MIDNIAVIQPEALARESDQYNPQHRRCKWTFTPLHESSVRVRRIWDHFPLVGHCTGSFLRIYSDSAKDSSPLKHPGYSSQCSVRNFPSEIVSREPITVEFETNDPSEINYLVDIAGTDSMQCPAHSSSTDCPDGPCCTGKNCRSCVINPGTDSLGKKGSFYSLLIISYQFFLVFTYF